jgi:putative transposase
VRWRYGATHLRYTRRINRREGWTGFLWQGRFASSPMDDAHLVHCVRYIGLNPVRSNLVSRAEDWSWSSVRAHLQTTPDPLLTREPLVERLGSALAGFFETDVDEACRRILRAAIDAGSPLGSQAWVEAHGLKLERRPVGRPRREIGDTHQFRPRTAAVR